MLFLKDNLLLKDYFIQNNPILQRLKFYILDLFLNISIFINKLVRFGVLCNLKDEFILIIFKFILCEIYFKYLKYFKFLKYISFYT